jgi:hypothetical protein
LRRRTRSFQDPNEKRRTFRPAALSSHYAYVIEISIVRYQDFSAQKLALEAGLSERYVNELLYEAGGQLHRSAERIAIEPDG